MDTQVGKSCPPENVCGIDSSSALRCVAVLQFASREVDVWWSLVRNLVEGSKSNLSRVALPQVMVEECLSLFTSSLRPWRARQARMSSDALLSSPSPEFVNQDFQVGAVLHTAEGRGPTLYGAYTLRLDETRFSG